MLKDLRNQLSLLVKDQDNGFAEARGIHVDSIETQFRLASRAFREWALRPGPMWTFVKSMNSWHAAKAALNVGWQALGWMK